MPTLSSVFQSLRPSRSRSAFLFWIIFLLCWFWQKERFLLDGDTGYHIRMGEYIWTHFQFARLDIFSYFTPLVAWSNHEWLSQVIFYFFHQLGSLSAIVLLSGFLVALYHSFLFSQMQKQTGTLAAYIATFFVLGNTYVHWLARPHLWTHLFFVLFLKILGDYQIRSINRLKWLPALMLFWVNLHGGFILGICLILFYAGMNFFQSFFFSEPQRKTSLQKGKILSLFFFFTTIVCLVNPDGIHAFLFPFQIAGCSEVLKNVQEFRSADFQVFFPFLYAAIPLLGTCLLSQKPVSFLQTALLLIFFQLSLYSIRHIPLFAIVAAPVFAEQLAHLWKSFNKPALAEKLRNQFSNINHQSRSPFLVDGIIFTAVSFMLFSTHLTSFEAKFPETSNPVNACEFIQKEKLTGNLFSDDSSGDYLIYRLWPEYKVFSYGFNDHSGIERFKDYEKVLRFKAGWEGVLNKHNVNWMVWPPESVQAVIFEKDVRWKLVYADNASMIFIRNTSKNRYWIEKYPDVKPVRSQRLVESQ